eukprot:TRINITY_DN1603_c0_g1_i2.p1 TRINITY_DN1603_c0_g1~~TRINITY_DN1603_c0_g1_i2.p1  ORF type:complete len:237 (+),score=42.29 TRINITY_DN1603_c0_g1_i2:680-1390(+)
MINTLLTMIRDEGSPEVRPFYLNENQIHCFEEYVFSESTRDSVVAYPLSELKVMIRTFRAAAFQWAGVPIPVPVDPPRRCIRKAWLYPKLDSSHKSILNFLEVAQWMREHTRLEVVVDPYFPALTVSKQVAYFSQFELFISPMGAQELVAMFLPDHAYVFSLPCGPAWLEYSIHPALDFEVVRPRLREYPEKDVAMAKANLTAMGYRLGLQKEPTMLGIDQISEFYQLLIARNMIC